MKKSLAVLLMLAIIPGCDDSEELTCEVLADPNFCWAVAVAEAYECNATAITDGQISADGKTCEFDNGATATFSPALDRTQEIFDIDTMTVTLSNADGLCAKLADNEAGLSLKTASGTVDTGGSANNYTVDCPNGTTYKSDKPFELLSCGGGTLFNSKLPGTSKGGGGNFITFGISPKPEGVETGFVECRYPEN
jgi:hypothetical protein